MTDTQIKLAEATAALNAHLKTETWLKSEGKILQQRIDQLERRLQKENLEQDVRLAQYQGCEGCEE
jgi:hypothetical protein